MKIKFESPANINDVTEMLKHIESAYGITVDKINLYATFKIKDTNTYVELGTDKEETMFTISSGVKNSKNLKDRIKSNLPVQKIFDSFEQNVK